MQSSVPKMVMAGLVGTLVLAGCAQPPAVEQPQDFRKVIRRAEKQVFPALVFLKPIRQGLKTGKRQREQRFGSGVIISTDGLVVTNSHVAKDAAEIKCVLSDKKQFPATVVGVDDDTDLALVRLELPPGHPPLQTVSFADSDTLTEGQFVMALGSPLGFTHSITFGVISSPRRYLEVGAYNLWIQTDAAINPGNSGGPLVDDRGRVIGINTLRSSVGENLGFAIPANTVKRVIDQLREKGAVTRAYSGIQLQAIKDFLRGTILDYSRGVVVGGVDENSPAAQAGLKAGDVILSCNGRLIFCLYLEDLPAVRNIFASLPIGEEAALTVLRDKEEIDLSLVPAPKPSASSAEIELPAWNCSAREISKFRTPALAYFHAKGVFVLGVRQPGNAFNCGIRSGDIILSIDGRPISNIASLRDLYESFAARERGQRTVLMEMMRVGHRYFTVLDFHSALESNK